MATDPEIRLLTAEEFLEIDFGPDLKAELDNGIIRMMAGGSEAHAWISGNILTFLRGALRGTPCRPYGSDFAVRAHDRSVRYPDVTVYCRARVAGDDKQKSFDDPRAIFEVLSPGTARVDRGIKLDEYKAIPSVDTIVFVDPATQRIRVVQRIGVGPDAWTDVHYAEPHDVVLPSLGITVPHAEIFADD